MDALQDRYRKQAHELRHIPVAVKDAAPACAGCGQRLHVQKTVQRSGMTLAHGSFRSRETVHTCPSGCKPQGGHAAVRAASLAQLLIPKSSVGYDVMVHVGLERFLHRRQRGEIQADLKSRYGIGLSSGAISGLGRRFLVYLEALHWKAAPALRRAQHEDGGWPLHIDGTGEEGRGIVIAAYSGWRGWVLYAWKASTECADFVLNGVQHVAAAFGPPCAIMRDLGRAVTEAADTFVRKEKLSIPVLACHYHFAADVGGDLLEAGHNQMRGLFRNAKILPNLRAFVRQHGRHLGESIGTGRDALADWLAHTEHTYLVPDGIAGIAVVRSLAQWLLDYHADSDGQPFPFSRPWLDLYCRCLHLAAAIRTFLLQPPADAAVRKSLEKLQRILRPVECDVPPFASTGASLIQRAELFDRLRAALRLEDKKPLNNSAAQTTFTLNDVRAAVEALTDSLRAERPARGPAKDRRTAIDVILTHLDRHGSNLWGHAIPLPGQSESGAQLVRLVERTNNDLESLFHFIKHGERRRSGRKFLAQDFESLPAAAALVSNLRHDDYVSIVCGSLSNLPAVFAQLDADNRSCSIAVAHQHETLTETASLSTLDKRIVRQPAMTDRILAASFG